MFQRTTAEFLNYSTSKPAPKPFHYTWVFYGPAFLRAPSLIRNHWLSTSQRSWVERNQHVLKAASAALRHCYRNTRSRHSSTNAYLLFTFQYTPIDYQLSALLQKRHPLTLTLFLLGRVRADRSNFSSSQYQNPAKKVRSSLRISNVVRLSKLLMWKYKTFAVLQLHVAKLLT